MQSKVDRKEAVRKFKEKLPSRGAFAVRCMATGAVWVGSSPNLEAARNGSWFSLRLGSHRNPELQSEWNTHGEAAFVYEILEKLKDDVHALAIADLLKEKKNHWVTQLGARPL